MFYNPRLYKQIKFHTLERCWHRDLKLVHFCLLVYTTLTCIRQELMVATHQLGTELFPKT